MPPAFAITDDATLKERVRTATGYEDSEEEVTDTELDTHVSDAKADLYARTDSQTWYDDTAYGQSLKWWTCIIVKAAVENIVIEEYTLGGGAESISYHDADPQSSQQIDMWADAVARNLDNADVENNPSPSFRNSSNFVG